MQAHSLFSFSELPEEVIEKILSSLSLHDLMNSQYISHLFKRISCKHQVWQNLFKKYFHVEITGANAMEKFILHYMCEKAFASEDKEKICQAYMKLILFNINNPQEKDSIWRNYLHGRFAAFHSPDLVTLFFSVDLQTEFDASDIKARLENLGAYNKFFGGELDSCEKLGVYLLEKAAMQGNPLAMVYLAFTRLNASIGAARILPNRTELEKDFVTWSHQAYKSGIAQGARLLASRYHTHFVEKVSFCGSKVNYLEYYRWLLKAAKKHDLESAYKLGLEYLNLENSTFGDKYLPLGPADWAYCRDTSLHAQIEAGDEEAFPKLKKYEEQGSHRAYGDLICFYPYSLGFDPIMKVNQDKLKRKVRGIYWLEQAADGGYQPAIDKLKELNIEIASESSPGIKLT